MIQKLEIYILKNQFLVASETQEDKNTQNRALCNTLRDLFLITKPVAINLIDHIAKNLTSQNISECNLYKKSSLKKLLNDDNDNDNDKFEITSPINIGDATKLKCSENGCVDDYLKINLTYEIGMYGLEIKTIEGRNAVKKFKRDTDINYSDYKKKFTTDINIYSEVTVDDKEVLEILRQHHNISDRATETILKIINKETAMTKGSTTNRKLLREIRKASETKDNRKTVTIHEVIRKTRTKNNVFHIISKGSVSYALKGNAIISQQYQYQHHYKHHHQFKYENKNKNEHQFMEFLPPDLFVIINSIKGAFIEGSSLLADEMALEVPITIEELEEVIVNDFNDPDKLKGKHKGNYPLKIVYSTHAEGKVSCDVVNTNNSIISNLNRTTDKSRSTKLEKELASIGSDNSKGILGKEVKKGINQYNTREIEKRTKYKKLLIKAIKKSKSNK